MIWVWVWPWRRKRTSQSMWEEYHERSHYHRLQAYHLLTMRVVFMHAFIYSMDGFLNAMYTYCLMTLPGINQLQPTHLIIGLGMCPASCQRKCTGSSPMYKCLLSLRLQCFWMSNPQLAEISMLHRVTWFFSQLTAFVTYACFSRKKSLQLALRQPWVWSVSDYIFLTSA